MITNDQIIEIGTFTHPHGINGEICATFDIDVNPLDLKCIVVNVEGIFVPFFISTVRPRGANSLLLTLDGINNETEASAFSKKAIYALKTDRDDCEEADEEADGFYAEDLIGFAIHDTDGRLQGVISDIDDTTENILFLVTDQNDNELMIPVADEYIEEIDPENRSVVVRLPEGLLEM